jgi:hypothetical protein
MQFAFNYHTHVIFRASNYSHRHAEHFERAEHEARLLSDATCRQSAFYYRFPFRSYLLECTSDLYLTILLSRAYIRYLRYRVLIIFPTSGTHHTYLPVRLVILGNTLSLLSDNARSYPQPTSLRCAWSRR